MKSKRMPAIVLTLLCIGLILPLHSAPIHDAAGAGDAATVYTLIEQYPTMLELRDERGASPLYYAAWSGHRDLVQGLIDRGAETTVATTDGLTPLHGGALNGHLDICRILLDNGADVNARSLVQGNTPLHIVWKGGYADIAALLIERGADINAVEKWYGMTPLHYAASYGRLELTETLLSHDARFDIADSSGRTASQVSGTHAVAALFRKVSPSD